MNLWVRQATAWLAACMLVLVTGCDSTLFSTEGAQVVIDTMNVSVTEGQSAQVGVRLNEQPSGNVVVRAELENGDGSISIEDGFALTFTGSNWNVTQYVSLAAALDSDTDNFATKVRFTVGGSYVMSVDVSEIDTGANEPPAEEEEEEEEENPENPGTNPPPTLPPVDPGEPQGGVALKIKDSSGQGAVDYPVTAVIPLTYGVYQNTDGFRMVDGEGTAVPAQFEVLNRWWARDNSLRHVMVHFRATVGANSHAFYSFQTQEGAGPAPSKSVTVTENNGVYTVDTGVVRFTVKDNGFNIFDTVDLDTNGDGTYQSGERMVSPGSSEGAVFEGRLSGDIQRARDRGNLKVKIEEEGPMRTVLRISSIGQYTSRDDHDHGFAMRIYAYAGKSYIKMDYQLQNSAKNVRFSAPLYFEDVSLNIKPTLSNPTVTMAPGPGNHWTGTVSGGRYLFQSSVKDSSVHNTNNNSTLRAGDNVGGEPSYGWADVSDSNRGVFVTTRQMAELWPNGYEVESDGNVAVRLWPRWSAQRDGGGINSTGLYWLDDMQHVVKESMIYFHGANVSATELDRLAMTFSRHPIPFVPVAEYQRTKSSFIWGGIVPINEFVTEDDDTGKLELLAARSVEQGSDIYNFGWKDAMADVERKAAAATGGFPESSMAIVATGRVDKWLTAEAYAMGELRARAQWIAEYTVEEDFERVQPSQDPYSSASWRNYDTSRQDDSQPLASGYLPGTSWDGWHPRDNAHGWFYHVEEFYWLSGNYWIRDWYDFIKEFRMSERAFDDFAGWSWHSRTGWVTVRGEGHSLANAMQAYRVTGDQDLMTWLRVRMPALALHRIEKNGSFGGSALGRHITSQFEHGFLAGALAQICDETQGYQRDIYNQAFQYWWGIVAYNTHQAQFEYHWEYDNPPSSREGSGGTSTPLADPSAYLIVKTGMTEYQPLLLEYLNGGVNGGREPFNNLSNTINWDGGPYGRITNFILDFNVVTDAPAKINNLAATTANNKIRLTWTTPADAKAFHVVWSTKPFSSSYTTDPAQSNPFSGTAVNQSLEATPGSSQSLDFTVSAGAGTKIYCLVYAISENGHFSPISNKPSVNAP